MTQAGMLTEKQDTQSFRVGNRRIPSFYFTIQSHRRQSQSSASSLEMSQSVIRHSCATVEEGDELEKATDHKETAADVSPEKRDFLNLPAHSGKKDSGYLSGEATQK